MTAFEGCHERVVVGGPSVQNSGQDCRLTPTSKIGAAGKEQGDPATRSPSRRRDKKPVEACPGYQQLMPPIHSLKSQSPE